MTKEAMKLALEALENSIDLVSHEARNAEELYGKYPSRLARIQGLVAFEVAHEKAITALREALAEQPARLPFGVVGGLVAIKTLLSRDPCVHANTAIQMIDAILAEQPAQQDSTCSNALRAQGKAYPRTCKKCGLGPCVELAQPAPVQQEPVFSFQMQLKPGWGGQYPKAIAIGEPDIESLFGKVGDVVTFYTSPPAQRTWVGLTDEEIEAEFGFIDELLRDCCYRTEAKLRSKNT